MITSYRKLMRNSGDEDWSLISDQEDGIQDVKDWLAELNFTCRITGKAGLSHIQSDKMKCIVYISDVPDDLKMLIKLSLPNIIQIIIKGVF